MTVLMVFRSAAELGDEKRITRSACLKEWESEWSVGGLTLRTKKGGVAVQGTNKGLDFAELRSDGDATEARRERGKREVRVEM